MNYKSIKGIFISFLYVLLLTYNASCDIKTKARGESSSAHSWIGKKVEFPDKLMLLDGQEIHPMDSFYNKYVGSNEVVLSIVDATCPTCIFSQLNSTDSLIQTMLKDKQLLIFILNVDKSDSAAFMVSMQPLIKAKGIILWDSNYYFETKNDLFTHDIADRTFLLNSNNEIIIVGNPLFKPNLKELYMSQLK